jgi:hypothetical protein
MKGGFTYKKYKVGNYEIEDDYDIHNTLEGQDINKKKLMTTVFNFLRENETLLYEIITELKKNKCISSNYINKDVKIILETICNDLENGKDKYKEYSDITRYIYTIYTERYNVYYMKKNVDIIDNVYKNMKEYKEKYDEFNKIVKGKELENKMKEYMGKKIDIDDKYCKSKIIQNIYENITGKNKYTLNQYDERYLYYKYIKNDLNQINRLENDMKNEIMIKNLILYLKTNRDRIKSIITTLRENNFNVELIKFENNIDETNLKKYLIDICNNIKKDEIKKDEKNPGYYIIDYLIYLLIDEYNIDYIKKNQEKIKQIIAEPIKLEEISDVNMKKLLKSVIVDKKKNKIDERYLYYSFINKNEIEQMKIEKEIKIKHEVKVEYNFFDMVPFKSYVEYVQECNRNANILLVQNINNTYPIIYTSGEYQDNKELEIYLLDDKFDLSKLDDPQAYEFYKTKKNLYNEGNHFTRKNRCRIIKYNYNTSLKVIAYDNALEYYGYFDNLLNHKTNKPTKNHFRTGITIANTGPIYGIILNISG